MPSRLRETIPAAQSPSPPHGPHFLLPKPAELAAPRDHRLLRRPRDGAGYDAGGLSTLRGANAGSAPASRAPAAPAPPSGDARHRFGLDHPRYSFRGRCRFAEISRAAVDETRVALAAGRL